jgi:hypothetical protein
MRLKLSRGLIAFLIFGNMLFAVANIPALKLVNSKPGYTSVWAHSFWEDYFWYLQFIRESRDGSWSIPDLHTFEPTKRTIAHTLSYIAFGKAAQIPGLTPIAAYHTARIISLELLLVSVYLVCQFFTGSGMAIWAAMIGLLSPPPFNVFGFELYGPPGDTWLPKAWDFLGPFARVDRVPHHMMSAGLMLLGVILFIRIIRKPEKIGFLLTGIITFTASFIHPSSAILLIAGLPLSAAINAIHGFVTDRINPKKFLIPVLTTVIPSLTALFIVILEIRKGPPWSVWSWYDQNYFNSFPAYNRDFILGAGIIGLIALPQAILNLIKPKDLKKVILSVWFFLPYILLPVSGLFLVSKVRLPFIFNFVPMGILAVQTVTACIRPLESQRRMLAPLIIGAGFVLFSFPTWKQEYHQLEMAAPLNNVQLPPGMAGAIGYIRNNVKPYARFLTSDVAGSILPAYVRTYTYVGDYNLTLDHDRKAGETEAFFTGMMTPEEAKRLIYDNGVEYILAVPELGAGYGFYGYSLKLTRVYDSPDASLWRVEEI